MAVTPLPQEAFNALYETARSQVADTPAKAANLDRYGAELARFPCREEDPVRLGWGLVGGAATLATKTDGIGPQITATGLREPVLEGFVAGLLLVAGIGSRYIDGAFPAPGRAAPPVAADEFTGIRRSAVENAVRSVPLFITPAPGQTDVMAYAQSRGPWQGAGVREHLAAAFPGMNLAAVGCALVVIGGWELHQGASEGVREAGHRWFKSGARRALDSAPRMGQGLFGALLALAGDSCLTAS